MLARHPLELDPRKKLTNQEITEAVRLAIIAELDAINLYLQLARSIEDEKIRKVFEDIAREEKTHVGEFLEVLKSLDPEQVQELRKGAEEVYEITGIKPSNPNQTSDKNNETNIDELVRTEVKRLIESKRVVSRKLPVIVVGRGVDAVSFEKVTDKHERIIVSLCEISRLFRISQRSIDQYYITKQLLEMPDVTKATSELIEEEEKKIVQSLINEAGVKLPISSWDEPGVSVVDIAKAVNELYKRGIPRPYLLIISPARFTKLLAISEKTGMTDLQRIKEMVDEVTISTHVPEDKAIVISTRREILDIVYGGFAEVDSIGPENGFIVYRLWSSLATRIRIPEGIVLLG
ncbi:MAG: family 1 encapsulin nanocompartment shell protein [Desulfurococcaceae archaeon]